MRLIGFYIILIGALSVAIHFLGLNFIFLRWIDTWGTEMGWIIRGGIILFGLVIRAVEKYSRKTPLA